MLYNHLTQYLSFLGRWSDLRKHVESVHEGIKYKKMTN